MTYRTSNSTSSTMKSPYRTRKSHTCIYLRYPVINSSTYWKIILVVHRQVYNIIILESHSYRGLSILSVIVDLLDHRQIIICSLSMSRRIRSCRTYLFLWFRLRRNINIGPSCLGFLVFFRSISWLSFIRSRSIMKSFLQSSCSPLFLSYSEWCSVIWATG